MWRYYLVPVASREPFLSLNFDAPMYVLDSKAATLQRAEVHRLAPPDTPAEELRLRIRWAAQGRTGAGGPPCTRLPAPPLPALPACLYASHVPAAWCQHTTDLASGACCCCCWCRDEVVTVDTAESLPTWEHAVQARIGGTPALRQAPTQPGGSLVLSRPTTGAGACSVAAVGTAHCSAAQLSPRSC